MNCLNCQCSQIDHKIEYLILFYYVNIFFHLETTKVINHAYTKYDKKNADFSLNKEERRSLVIIRVFSVYCYRIKKKAISVIMAFADKHDARNIVIYEIDLSILLFLQDG